MQSADSIGAAANLTTVQIIWTRWTKKSRGAPASVVRNAVAEAASLPLDVIAPNGGMLWHEVIHDESRAFEARDVVRIYAAGTRNFSAVEIISQPDGLTIALRGTQRLELPRNTYGRLIFNYAEDRMDDGWSTRIYNKVCINAILGAPPSNDMFRQRAPDRELCCLDHLP